MKLLLYTLGYAILLSSYSFTRFMYNSFVAEHSGVIGYLIFAIMFIYLWWALKVLFPRQTRTGDVIQSAVIIAAGGSVITSLVMAYYNNTLGLDNNWIIAVRGLLVHAVFALVVSFFYAKRINQRP